MIPKRRRPSKVCLLCGKSSKELLIHLRIDHEIEDAEQYIEALRAVEGDKERMRQFAAYVEELWKKKAAGLVTAEDYRRLTMDWAREHE